MVRVIYFDIETVSGVADFQSLSPSMQDLWTKKAQHWITDELDAAALYPIKAGIFAEFGKIVCISYGYYDADGQMQTHSFAGDDERSLIQGFFDLLHQYPQAILCGHNIKEFDIPYVCRRALVLGLALPPMLQIQGKKPREITHMDTLEMRKFGDYKNYTSLALLCEIFGIPTSKDDIDGSEVTAVYWQERNIDRIRIYCEKDVIATAQLYSKLRGRSF